MFYEINFGVKNATICKTLQIRSVQNLDKFLDCRVIIGNLTFLNMDIMDNITFPQLRIVTGYVGFFFVKRLKSLSNLLPNLTAIKGNELFINKYSLVIQSTQLENVGLENLRSIVNGKVLIANNPNLCYITSIKWELLMIRNNIRNISSHRSNLNSESDVDLFNNRLFCMDTCLGDCDHSFDRKIHQHRWRACWNYENCQKICGENCRKLQLSCLIDQPNKCCHSNCIGGCYGVTNKDCVACRNLLFQDSCVEFCPADYLQLGQVLCVSQEQCLNQPIQSQYNAVQSTIPTNHSIESNKCVEKCSSGKYRNSFGFCVDYDSWDQSKKHCGEIYIHNPNDIESIHGCYSVKSIYISIKDKSDSIAPNLINAFSHLRIVETSVKIIGTSLKSLNFLKNLQVIRGHNVHISDESNKPLVLEVYDNYDLREIVSSNTVISNSYDVVIGNSSNSFIRSQHRITLERGYLSFILNRKLCAHHIINFIQYNIQSNITLSNTDRNIIDVSNGDLGFCKQLKLLIVVESTFDTSLRVICKPSDHSTSYIKDRTVSVIFMIKKTSVNITQPDVQNDCNANEWEMVEGYLDTSVIIENLGPATRYALYAESFRSRINNWVVGSDIIYVTTKSRYPSPPINFLGKAINDSSIEITWSPPIFPNGLITKYIIRYKEIEIKRKELFAVNFCYQENYFYQKGLINKTKGNQSSNNTNGQSSLCNCEICEKKCQKIDIVKAKQEYQFTYHLYDSYISILFSKEFEYTHPTWNMSLDSNADSKFSQFNYFWDNNFTNNEKTKPSSQVSTNSPVTNKSLTSHSDTLSSNLITAANLITVPSTRFMYRLNNLNHYRQYLFEIQACQDPDTKTVFMFDMSAKRYCSFSTFVSVFTMAKKKADNINSDSIKISVIKQDVLIHWDEPKAPNGIIVYFLFQYRLKGETRWFMKCISRTLSQSIRNSQLQNSANHSVVHYSQLSNNIIIRDFQSIQIVNLPAGNYEFRVKSVSSHSNGSWTSLKSFTILSRNILTPKEISYVIVGLMVILGLVAVLCYFVYQYYQKRLNAKRGCVSSNPNYWLIYDIDEWEIDRKYIDMIDWNCPLGRGSFGMAYKAILRKLTTPAGFYFTMDEQLGGIYIAVKTLNPENSILERREFINEACYMKQFQSYHLVRLIGVVSTIDSHNNQTKKQSPLTRYKLINGIVNSVTHRLSDLTIRMKVKRKSSNMFDDLSKPLESLLVTRHFSKMPLVLMELMENGDLVNYLRRQGQEGGIGYISESQSHLWALQIADGMLYLSDRRFVHRDLAARNCLINAHNVVKIGDFGMARDVYYDCYYRKQGKTRLPIRWMAPEAMQSYFTSASDVWSYGVVLWEISTMASLPYRGMSHMDVVQFVGNGGTLLNANQQMKSTALIQSLMEQCWQFDPDYRITFLEIVQLLIQAADDNFNKMSHWSQRTNGVTVSPENPSTRSQHKYPYHDHRQHNRQQQHQQNNNSNEVVKMRPMKSEY